SENGASFLKGFHVFVLVIGGALLPALKEDANPFVSQRPNDGVVFFALVRVVLHIVARPLAVGDREAAKLVKGLPVKLGTSRASIDDSAFAAALGHRSDAGEALHVERRRIARAVGAKEGQEARCQRGARAGEAGEELDLRMGIEDSLDALLVVRNDGIERLNEPNVHLAQATPALDDGRVGGQGLGFFRQGQDSLNYLWATNVVAVIEAFEGAGLGLLKLLKGGPFEQ